MASIRFTGNAVAVAKVDSITPATPLVTNTFSVTINGKTITYTAGAAPTVASVCTALAALLTASTIPEFAEITWTDNTTNILATNKTVGADHTITSAATGGTAANVTASVTAGAGPNWWSSAANWSGGLVPVNSDTVTIDGGAWTIKSGLDQNAVTLTSLTIASTFTGTIGLPNYNTTSGTAAYAEYRMAWLKIKSPIITIEDGAGQGSSFIRINGSNQDTNLIVRKALNGQSGTPAVLFIGTGANTINVASGDVGVAFFGGEIATVASILHSGGTLQFGVGMTYSTCTIVDSSSSGDLTLNGSPSVIKKTGSSKIIQLAGVPSTSLTIDGGTYDWRCGGTIPAISVASGATLRCEGDNRAKIGTAISCYSGCKIDDRRGTLSGVLTTIECSPADCQLNLGPNRQLTIAA